MNFCPSLKPHHNIPRLNFGKNNMNRDWTKVIFSDEKKFVLDGPDGFNGYWRDLRKEPLIFSKRNCGGGSQMVWAAFNANGTVAIEFVSSKMNSSNYIDVLKNNLLPYLLKIPENTFVFQQDNASILQAWARIDQKSISNLINFMTTRIFQLINRSGGLTDY